MQPKQCEESEKRARRNQIRERRVKEARNVRSLATLCFPMLLWRGSAICNDAFHTGFFFTSWIRTFCGEGAAFQLENTPVVDALRDRCSISYDLASPFCGRRNAVETYKPKKTNHIETVRTSCRKAAVSTSQCQSCKEVLQSSFVLKLASKFREALQNSFFLQLATLKIWKKFREIPAFSRACK